MAASSQTSEITLHVGPEFGDYLRFVRWTTRRQLGRVRIFGWICLLAFALSPLLPIEADGAVARYRSSLYLLILPILMFVVLPAITYAAARKRWSRVPEVYEPRTFVFSDDGVAYTSATVRATSGWNHFTRAHEAVGHVLLETAQQTFHTIPVRAIDSQETLERLRELITSKVLQRRRSSEIDRQ